MWVGPVQDAVNEFSELSLGDARLDRRIRTIIPALQERPDASFPQAMGDDAATEAFYRLISNDRVSWSKVLDAHVHKTHGRMVGHDRVLAVHDSSLFQFEGEELREGLFRTTKGKCGFLGHVCLAVAGDGSRLPLGLLGMLPVVRPQDGAPEHGAGKVYLNESERWQDLVAIVEDEAPADVRVVHVMDREGDAYALMDFLHLLEADFVIRLAQDRRVLSPIDDQRLSDILPSAVVRLVRSVQLSERSDRKRAPALKESHPARDERVAQLEVRVLQTRFVRPKGLDAHADSIPVNIVHVVETNPPVGEAPVSWLLATTLPVDTAEQAAAVVDAYRARWLIEEFFKALKTGCAYQDRQLESIDTLLVAFSLLAPLAWRLLTLRWMARNDPERPASDIFTSEQLACLRHVDNEQRERLPAQPTVRQAMFAIARLGGFLRQNKEPGWQVLGRGFRTFNTMFRGYALGLGIARDQDEVEALEM